MIGALLAFALAGFFAVLLLMTAVALMAWLIKPEGIRPAWWDWGMDKLIKKVEKSEIEAQVEIVPEWPEVETAPLKVVEQPPKLETPKPTKPAPRW